MPVQINQDDLEHLDLATGASGEADLDALLPTKVAGDINRLIQENSFARQVFRPNEDLVGATGLSISYPLKERTIAQRLSDMGEVLVDQGEFSNVDSEVFLLGARAEWSYAAEEAQLFDLMSEEVMDAIQALVRFENEQVVTVIEDNVDASNDAAFAGSSFAYQDVIEMRADVSGPMDNIVIHPDDMAALLQDDNFVSNEFGISRIRQLEPQTTVFETNLGITFWETEEAIDSGTVVGASSARAGRFTIKTRPRTQRYDKGESGGELKRGVTVWEMIDAVATRGGAMARRGPQ